MAGPVKFVKKEGKVNAAKHGEILEDNLFQSAREV